MLADIVAAAVLAVGRISSDYTGTDAGMITTPADYCSPIVWDEGATMEHSPALIYTADAAVWQSLLDMGWHGQAGDGMEALYPADCLIA